MPRTIMPRIPYAPQAPGGPRGRPYAAHHSSTKDVRNYTHSRGEDFNVIHTIMYNVFCQPYGLGLKENHYP